VVGRQNADIADNLQLPPPLKLQPYGSIEMNVLLLLGRIAVLRM